ncbi:MAG: hypothetical protein ACE5I1_00250 [bacterium]
MKKILFYLILYPLFHILVGCNATTPTEPIIDNPVSDLTKIEESLIFKGVRPTVQPPCQVQFFFSVRDLQNRAMIFSQNELAEKTRIFENNTEIDYSETNFFVSNADNFRMDIVMVLDFTNSMASFLQNNQTAIDQMLLGSKEIIRSLGAAHRVALLEFHDRNFEPQVLSYFTSDTTFLIGALDAFASSQIDNGSSRVWDAVHKGLQLFPDEDNPDNVRLLIFLSDGYDTSSRFTPDNIIELANKKFAQIHSVGTGNVRGSQVLEKITHSTEGLFYAADSLSDITFQLNEIAANLSGQYKLSYISLLQQSKPEVKVQIEYDGKFNSFAQVVDLTVVDNGQKDDRIGRLTYDGSVVADERATAVLRLQHTPRNINTFRFRIQSDLLKQIEIIPQTEGGVLDSSWQLSVGNDGWFTLHSDAKVLPFGAFGLLVKAQFSPISGSGLNVPFSLDNTIYNSGKSFIAPDTLRLGLPINNPSPIHESDNVSKQPAFSWQIEAADSVQVEIDFHLDTARLATALAASNLQANTFTPAQPLAANKTYYWKIVVHTGRNHFTGPVWKFTTGN